MRYEDTEKQLEIKAIPTYYKGIRFRSRLEAAWARFFDLLVWRWDYEPFDLPGWTPDFVIAENSTILVEVKPVYDLPLQVTRVMERAVAKSPYRSAELLVVGTGPWWDGDERVAYLGWLGECGGESFLDESTSHCFDRAPMGVWDGGAEVRNKKIGFCHETGSYRDRITGIHDGGCYGEGWFVPQDLLRLWAIAKNGCQFRGEENPQN